MTYDDIEQMATMINMVSCRTALAIHYESFPTRKWRVHLSEDDFDAMFDEGEVGRFSHEYDELSKHIDGVKFFCLVARKGGGE